MTAAPLCNTIVGQNFTETRLLAVSFFRSSIALSPAKVHLRMTTENPWKKRDSRLVYENPWIKVREDSVKV